MRSVEEIRLEFKQINDRLMQIIYEELEHSPDAAYHIAKASIEIRRAIMCSWNVGVEE